MLNLHVLSSSRQTLCSRAFDTAKGPQCALSLNKICSDVEIALSSQSNKPNTTAPPSVCASVFRCVVRGLASALVPRVALVTRKSHRATSAFPSALPHSAHQEHIGERQPNTEICGNVLMGFVTNLLEQLGGFVTYRGTVMAPSARGESTFSDTAIYRPAAIEIPKTHYIGFPWRP